MKNIITTTIALFTFIIGVLAQNTGIGITTPDASAKLEVNSTTQGFLAPRMTAAERDAIANPTDGLWVYITDINCFSYFVTGTGWQLNCGESNPGSIATLDCAGATVSGTLINGIQSTVSVVLDYTGGVSGIHYGQSVASTGVTGLIATLPPGIFNTGAGTLTYTITGTPQGTGNANFLINIGGQSCNLIIPVSVTAAVYTIGTGGNCSNPSIIGTYEVSTNLDGTNILTINVTVTQIGTWNISSYPYHGYNFSGSGNFAGTGSQTAMLFANGTPVVCSSDRVLLTGDAGSAGSCKVDINVNSRPTTHWQDRNLGATQVATSPTDPLAVGYLYQWGRGNDGHQVKTSNTTLILSSSDDPGHGDFIRVAYTSTGVNDWRTPQNDNLWQGESGINNPCPSGYRVPTAAELSCESFTWPTLDQNGAFTANNWVFNLSRSQSSGSISTSQGCTWSSSQANYYGGAIYTLKSNSSSVFGNPSYRAQGCSVRCIQD